MMSPSKHGSDLARVASALAGQGKGRPRHPHQEQAQSLAEAQSLANVSILTDATLPESLLRVCIICSLWRQHEWRIRKMHFNVKQFIQVVTAYVLAVFAAPQSVFAQAAEQRSNSRRNVQSYCGCIQVREENLHTVKEFVFLREGATCLAVFWYAPGAGQERRCLLERRRTRAARREGPHNASRLRGWQDERP